MNIKKQCQLQLAQSGAKMKYDRLNPWMAVSPGSISPSGRGTASES